MPEPAGKPPHSDPPPRSGTRPVRPAAAPASGNASQPAGSRSKAGSKPPIMKPAGSSTSPKSRSAPAAEPGSLTPPATPTSTTRRTPRAGASAAAAAPVSAVSRLPTRTVTCTWCGGTVSIALSAKSVVCSKCNKRLVIEDFSTASYHAVRLLATCGNIMVEKAGHVVATVQAANLTVAGKLTGNATIAGRVVLHSTAQMKGDIEAAALRIESGAALEGFVRVRKPTAVADAGGST